MGVKNISAREKMWSTVDHVSSGSLIKKKKRKKEKKKKRVPQYVINSSLDREKSSR